MKSITQTHSLKTLPLFCAFLKEHLPKGGIVLLQGDLAAGKTTLVKEFAKFLHLDSPVSSPTFSVLNEYEDIIKHYDIYQIGTEGFLSQGLLQTLDQEEKYYFIEWAEESFESLLAQMGFNYIKVNISMDKEAKRRYEVNICMHLK
jgi:tRNA threonylcarbamoyladenosine biosynthesis protein TsaE